MLLMAVLACLLLVVYFYLQGKETWVVSCGLWELAVIWLLFTRTSEFASLIDALARPGSRVVEIISRPLKLNRFSLLVEEALPSEELVRSHLLPPPFAPTFFSHV